jgi:hypothetical protein
MRERCLPAPGKWWCADCDGSKANEHSTRGRGEFLCVSHRNEDARSREQTEKVTTEKIMNEQYCNLPVAQRTLAKWQNANENALLFGICQLFCSFEKKI